MSDEKVGMVGIQNSGKHRRVIFDHRGRAIPIAPGATRNVELSESQARRMDDRHTRGGSLVIGDAGQLKQDAKDRRRQETAAKAKSDEGSKAEYSAAQLLAIVEDDNSGMNYSEWSSHARATLGEDHAPKSNKKTDIVAALQAKHKADGGNE